MKKYTLANIEMSEEESDLKMFDAFGIEQTVFEDLEKQTPEYAVWKGLRDLCSARLSRIPTSTTLSIIR